jgi:hypothetical protein
MTTLVLSTWTSPGARALADAACALGWRSRALDEDPGVDPGRVVYYGGSDVAEAAAARFSLALLEPPLDLLARLPPSFRQRAVEYGTFADLRRLKAPTFVKPADPLNKAFDAGIYHDAALIRAPRGVAPDLPVLVSEPVPWTAEYRCFVRDGEVVAHSPYLSFGRPVWRPHQPGSAECPIPAPVGAMCDRLRSQAEVALPPAFVVDVGLIEDRGWAVVEFNPVWCSGLLGANPAGVLEALDRACRNRDTLDQADRRWAIRTAGRT